jgi:hypothetical protein
MINKGSGGETADCGDRAGIKPTLPSFLCHLLKNGKRLINVRKILHFNEKGDAL